MHGLNAEAPLLILCQLRKLFSFKFPVVNLPQPLFKSFLARWFQSAPPCMMDTFIWTEELLTCDSYSYWKAQNPWRGSWLQPC